MNSSTSSASAAGGSTRTHACVLCQQRKVKCSRESPCSGCVKSRIECVYRDPPPPRRRKRRSPEDILLARLKRYEELLENAGVKVDPIGGAKGGATAADDDHEQVDEGDLRQNSLANGAARQGRDQHDAGLAPVSDALPPPRTGAKSANPGRFIVEAGRSRYLEK